MSDSETTLLFVIYIFFEHFPSNHLSHWLPSN